MTNISLTNCTESVCCQIDCCDNIELPDDEDAIDYTDKYLGFWMFVIGLLAVTAFISHSICLLVQHLQHRNRIQPLLKSLGEGDFSTTKVGEDGAILPNVVYWKFKKEKECVSQASIENVSIPLSPGYNYTNQVRQVWDEDHHMYSLYNPSTLQSMVYQPDLMSVTSN